MLRRLWIGVVSVAACVATSALPAHATSAHVAISAGGLTMSNPSVTVVKRNPTELDLRTVVTDARGTGSGWFVTLAAAAPGAPASAGLIVTGADDACQSGSACTLPRDTIAYPLIVSLTGTRTRVFEATPSSGLGSQSIDLHVVIPDSAARLSFDLSISTPLGLTSTAVSTSPACSIPDLLKSGTCPRTP